MSKKEDKDSLFCSFCGKSQKEVKKLIAGPTVYICNECVDLCNEIIDDEDIREVEPEVNEEIPKPSEIRDHLDSYVIGQDNAKNIYQLQFIIIIRELLTIMFQKREMMILLK